MDVAVPNRRLTRAVDKSTQRSTVLEPYKESTSSNKSEISSFNCISVHFDDSEQINCLDKSNETIDLDCSNRKSFSTPTNLSSFDSAIEMCRKVTDSPPRRLSSTYDARQFEKALGQDKFRFVDIRGPDELYQGQTIAQYFQAGSASFTDAIFDDPSPNEKINLRFSRRSSFGPALSDSIPEECEDTETELNKSMETLSLARQRISEIRRETRQSFISLTNHGRSNASKLSIALPDFNPSGNSTQIEGRNRTYGLDNRQLSRRRSLEPIIEQHHANDLNDEFDIEIKVRVTRKTKSHSQ